MTEQTISVRVERIVAEVFGIPVESIALESSPETIEGWDSMGHLNLVLALEQEFHVQFSPDEIEKMLNIDEAINIVGRYAKGSAV